MSQPDDQSVETTTSSGRPWARKLKFLWWITLVVGLVLAAGFWYWRQSSSVVERRVVAEAGFTVYAPRQAPAGYVIESDQTSLKNDILTYKFTSQSDGGDMVVTVQDRPDGFSMSEISKGGSISSTAMDSGTLYDLSTGEAGQYLLDTGVSLVYITSQGKIDKAAVNALANDLRKIN